MNDARMHPGMFGRRVRGWFSQPLVARVGPAGILLEHRGRTWQGVVATTPVAVSGEPSPAVVAAFRETLATAAVAPGRVKIVLSDQWLRPMVLALPAARLSDAEIDVLVAYRYRQIFGNQMQGWVWRRAMQHDGLLLAMAWPEALLAGLREAVADWGGTLSSALPESIHAVRCARLGPADTWVVVAEPRHATVLRLGEGAWRHWRCQELAATADSAMAESVCNLLQRTATRLGDGCRDLVIIESGTCGPWPRELGRRMEAEGWTAHVAAADQAASHAAPHLDFAHAPGRATRTRHLLLAGAAMLIGIELGALAWTYQSMETERAQLEDERGRLLKRLRPAAEPSLSKEMAARVQGVRNMVASLSIPWEGLLAELESVRGDKIVVESLRPDPVGRKVEITATAPAFGDITEFIDRVNGSKALHQAFLVSETAAREPGIRFVATATWRETE
ncbi:MAG: PilN domain-containing protein [Sulfuritalea sp.]|nr:PilN domain-containing protein [Sulfuritalea sp.]